MGKALSSYRVGFGGGINDIVQQISKWEQEQDALEKKKKQVTMDSTNPVSAVQTN